MKKFLSQLLREPLVHFLFIGACLFLLYEAVQGETVRRKDQIVVTSAKVEHLTQIFRSIWQRPPTAPELDGVIQDYIREEILYREGIALGLDKDDTIIRRRLRQKVEFVYEGLASSKTPTDAELQIFLDKNSQRFRIEPKFNFSQIYLSPEKHGDQLTTDAQRLLEELNRSNRLQNLNSYGDPLLLPHDYVEASPNSIARDFGETFANRLFQLEPGNWQGPVQSGYGVHLVFIKNKSEATIPQLDQVRTAVMREWSAERQKEASKKLFEPLLKRYQIIIEPSVKATRHGMARESS